MSARSHFSFDVFLSYSEHDKAVARALADRLSADGVRVWFDEWQITKDDERADARIERGLENSRTLVLCMSANMFGSDWPRLESYTYRFRDPQNRERRLVPVRLDKTPVRWTVGQLLFIDWSPEERARQYPRLLEACRIPEKPQPVTEADVIQFAETVTQLDEKPIEAFAFDSESELVLTNAINGAVAVWSGGVCLHAFSGHASLVTCVAWGRRHKRFLSGSSDRTLRLWDLSVGKLIHVFEGHTDTVNGVACSSDDQRALSCSQDTSIRLWDLRSGRCLRVLEGHKQAICSITWSLDQTLALSASEDTTVRLWDVDTGQCTRVLEGHTDTVYAALMSADQTRAVSGSGDRTVRVWDLASGRCLAVLEGHVGAVKSLAWSVDQQYVLSGGEDATIRLWSVEFGVCLCVIKGNDRNIRCVAWGYDKHHALAGDSEGVIRKWNLSKYLTTSLEKPSPSSINQTHRQVHYTNAKVLLVGESGVGKTGLSKRLALDDWQPSDSTVGAWATHWKLPVIRSKDVEREIWLWDFGGQADQRLIHQLYMDDTALAVLIFDGQKDGLFETMGIWDRDLTRASRKKFSKLLVAGRVDAGGLRVSRSQVENFAKERGFAGFLETSAKVGTGCQELKHAILDSINWEDIPWRSSPLLFKRLKDEVIRLKDEGRILMRFNELRDTLRLRLVGEFAQFSNEELGAV